MRRITGEVARGWARLGLLTQFLVLVTVLLWSMHFVAVQAERRFAKRYLFETALEFEQALARGLLSRFVADLEPEVELGPQRLAAIDSAVREHLAGGHFEIVKLWSPGGRLLYRSNGDPHGVSSAEEAVLRAATGEVVVAEVAKRRGSGFSEGADRSSLYEVYIPLENAEGRIVAVGEIYRGFDDVLARVRTLGSQMARGRYTVLLAGLVAMGVLVALAQGRIRKSEAFLFRTKRKEETLSRRVERLADELDRVRRQSGDPSDLLLRRLRDDLREGPLQLLSLSVLYASRHEARHGADDPHLHKARELNLEALEELRRLISEPVAHEHAEESLLRAADRVISGFNAETGARITWSRTDPIPPCCPADREMAAALLRCILHYCHACFGEHPLRVSLTQSAEDLTLSLEGWPAEREAEPKTMASALAGLDRLGRRLCGGRARLAWSHVADAYSITLSFRTPGRVLMSGTRVPA